MTRQRVAGVGLAAVLLAALPARAVSQQAPAVTFRAGADVVAVEAAVRRDKRPVTGLRAGDFELLDNGVPQQISDLNYERLPIDVTVVLDVSASVTGAVLDQLRQSVQRLKADLGPRDRLKLVAFNMQVRRLADFEAPAAATDTAFASLSGRGSSAIFDSVAVQLATPVLEGRRHLIVLFTDGQDSSSISDPDALFDVAKRTSSTVAIVLAATAPERSSASPFARSPGQPPITVGRMYDQLARETGGVVVTTAPGEDLASTFRRTLSEFRASYVLYYTPQGVARDGSHAIDVRVKQDGTEVRARRAYIWK
nr:putative von Willebrand factor type A domain protein [uncultured bacterium]AGD93322.1 putative von Willebrand factor type A domain protein [uncultured bacterium]